jgi:hypothetical protein
MKNSGPTHVCAGPTAAVTSDKHLRALTGLSRLFSRYRDLQLFAMEPRGVFSQL